MAKKSEPTIENKTTTSVKKESNSEKTLNKYHIVIFQQHRDEIFDRALVSQIQFLLDKTISTSRENTHIDVWLESPGGSADAAYKLVLELRSRCVKFWTIVPDYAKSAATLLVLGADCIFMAPAAELGPLDVQIEHPDREDTTISGLDVTNSLEYLTTTALNLALVGGASVLKYTGLPRREVLHELLQFIAQFMQPLISKLDPHIIHKATNELRVAEEYAVRMLNMRKLDKDKGRPMDKGAAKKLLKRLVKDYPTHGFVISRTEAKELGLPVCNIEDYGRCKQVKDLYTLSCDKQQTIVDVIPDSEWDNRKEGVKTGEKCHDTCSESKTKTE